MKALTAEVVLGCYERAFKEKDQEERDDRGGEGMRGGFWGC